MMLSFNTQIGGDNTNNGNEKIIMNDNWKISKLRAIEMIIASLIIFFFVWWRSHDTETSEQRFLTSVLKERFHGRVDSVYRDTWDHNEKKVRLRAGYIYTLYPQWESKVELGDSLSKQRDSFIVKVFKSNGTKVDLNYNEIAKGFKK